MKSLVIRDVDQSATVGANGPSAFPPVLSWSYEVCLYALIGIIGLVTPATSLAGAACYHDLSYVTYNCYASPIDAMHGAAAWLNSTPVNPTLDPRFGCDVLLAPPVSVLPVFDGSPASFTSGTLRCNRRRNDGYIYYDFIGVDIIRNPDVRYLDRYYYIAVPPAPNACPKTNPGTGDPIFPLTGVNRQEIDLGVQIGGQSLMVTYDTSARVPETLARSTWLVPPPPSFGPQWQSSFHKSMVLQSDGGPGSAYSSLALQRGGNAWMTAGVVGFDSCAGAGGGGSSYIPTTAPALRVAYSGAAGQVVDQAALTEESYDASGALVGLVQASGRNLRYTYSDSSTSASVAPAPGLLIQVTDPYGRAVKFNYEQPALAGSSPRIVLIEDAGGQKIQTSYDAAGNLSQLQWADGSVRRFLYERSDLPWALSGIVDENDARYATYGYDTVGRANSTELAGGVDKYTFQYADGGQPYWSVTQTTVSANVICREHRLVAPTGTVVTSPTGQASNVQSVLRQGMVALSAQSQPAGSGCSSSSSHQDYDDAGNVTAYDDFNGNRSCFAYDTARRLRTLTLSGLSSAAACPPDLSRHMPDNGDGSHPQRIRTTAWHPDWTLEIRRAEPGRITTWVYNGQPDPTGSNAVTACAPATAKLPDGKPVAVLCKRVEQATTDTDGHLGFAAALQAGVPNRVQTWTYNALGQVLTTKGPRTDLDDTTTYTYYADTTLDHTLGDLATVRNSLGQVTRYLKYNRNGQVLEMTDPNSVLTVNAYDPRQRLTSTSVAGLTTTYDYWPTGLPKRVTSPDGSWIGYQYDDAHRLWAVSDNLGNRIEYTLDNAGQRTEDKVKDPLGTLSRQVSRSIDALGRVQQTTGRR